MSRASRLSRASVFGYLLAAACIVFIDVCDLASFFPVLVLSACCDDVSAIGAIRGR